MKKMISCVVISGFAGLAAAQSQFSLTIQPSVTSVVGGGVFTATVYGDASVGTHMLGGAFGLMSGSSFVESMSWSPAAWSQFNSDGGYAGNGNYNAVIFGQLVLPDQPPFDQPADGSELGEAIGSFTITMSDDYANQVVVFSLTPQDPFVLETIDAGTGATHQSSDGQLTLGEFRIGIPSPSTLALLGMGGVVGARRRR